MVKRKGKPVKRDFLARKTKTPNTNNKKNKKKTGPLTHKHRDYLSLLARTGNKSRRNQLIDAGTGSQIKAISECIHNIIFGNVPLEEHEKDALRKYKHVLTALAQKCQPVYKKKTMLKQKGGFLQYLIPVALSALSSLFGGH